MNNIGSNIRRIREQKGFSQEYMADRLNISQATYARYENQQIQMKLSKIEEIAEVLETNVLGLMDPSKITIQNQTNNEGSYGNGYVENLHIDNKETTKKLIQTLENEIEHLKSEIDFLRECVKKG